MEISLEANNCYEYKEKKHSLIEASFANKTRYEFANKKAQYIVSKQQVDGCLIKGHEACDWLFTLKKDNSNDGTKNNLIFVELKDSDLIKAISQIENSIKQLGSAKKDVLVHARIVLTKTYLPDINDNRVKKFIKLIESNGGTVVYRSQKLIETKIS